MDPETQDEFNRLHREMLAFVAREQGPLWNELARTIGDTVSPRIIAEVEQRLADWEAKATARQSLSDADIERIAAAVVSRTGSTPVPVEPQPSGRRKAIVKAKADPMVTSEAVDEESEEAEREVAAAGPPWNERLPRLTDSKNLTIVVLLVALGAALVWAVMGGGIGGSRSPDNQLPPLETKVDENGDSYVDPKTALPPDGEVQSEAPDPAADKSATQDKGNAPAT